MSINDGFPNRVPVSSQNASGLMSASDKTKLDSINPGDILEYKEEIDKLKSTITPTKIYGISIDTSNSDPYSSVIYTDNAIGFTPLFVNQNTTECNYGSWKEVISDLIKPKPVLVKDGSVIMYLDESNYTRNIYGTTIDITDGKNGDIMIEFSKLYYKLYKEGNVIKFQISNKKVDSTWSCNAFMSEEGLLKEVDRIYIAAYEGSLDLDGNLRSLSNMIPETNKPIFQFRNYAENNGIKYRQFNMVKREYISYLTILVTKCLNVQTKIGKGYSELEWSGNNDAIKTGTMNTKGLFFGEDTGKYGIKVFGIENFWGNINEFVEGFIRNNDTVYYKKGGPYNDNGTGYLLAGKFPPHGGGWIVSKTVVDNSISIPSDFDGGASNIYFADYCYMNATDDLVCIATFGGAFYNNLSCGISCLDLRLENNTINQATGSRLVCTQ